jgi:putative ABC transport system permease protein
VTRVFVRQKIKSVAILKCIGASTGQVLATYVVQVALLAMAGSLIGVGLAAAAIRSIPPSLTESFGGLPYGLTVSAVLQGLTVGLLVSVLFALVPLLDVRRIKPLLLIRGADGPATAMTGAAGGGLRERLRKADWLQVVVALAVGSALVGVASWQAGSWRAGAAVSVGFAVVAAVLYLAAFVLMRMVKPLASAPWFPLRHAVISLRRRGNQPGHPAGGRTQELLKLGVRALRNNLVAEFSVSMIAAANMFIIDVQRDQAEGSALLRERRDRSASQRAWSRSFAHA